MAVFIEELFYALTGFLVISAVLEVLFPRMVLAYINLNIVLLIWCINAIILLGITSKNRVING